MKHRNKQNGNLKVPIVDFKCIYCDKVYKYKSGLSRHRKKCKIITDENVEMGEISYHLSPNEEVQKNPNEDSGMSNAILKLVESNQKLVEQNTEMMKCMKEQSIVTQNNTTNNISINFFLNEQCKNAMNLKDFVNNIKLQLLDIKMGNNYVDCVSNILIKNLKDLTPTERPIHCTDQKRLQFYVKDGESWEKDINQLDKSIDNIHNKQYELLHTFDEKYKDNDIDFNERQKIANIVYEPSLKDKTNINEAIKRKVCDAVDIKNDLYIK